MKNFKVIQYRGLSYQVPDIANYIATDKDGEVWWYADKPKVHDDDKYWDGGRGDSKQLTAVCLDWLVSLEEV